MGDEYNVQEFHFNRDVANGLTKDFNGRQTDISKAIHQLNDRFVNQNTGALIIKHATAFTTKGSDPQYGDAKNFKNHHLVPLR